MNAYIKRNGGENVAKLRLTKEQIIRRNWIIEQMNDFKDIDLPIVESLAFALDRLEYMDSRLNDVPSLLSDKVYMSSREKILKQVHDSYKMLDITAQARNKVNTEPNTATNADPLEALLNV